MKQQSTESFSVRSQNALQKGFPYQGLVATEESVTSELGATRVVQRSSVASLIVLHDCPASEVGRGSFAGVERPTETPHFIAVLFPIGKLRYDSIIRCWVAMAYQRKRIFMYFSS